ncbi:uncharacterized protein RJT21DRAFT_122429 [Scheffersomyces amazonensis]|uniref:uncharacterized protein n=1 Tax=Scheffersomyces amazonensis TaxID=1078765 RepID=UPI00315D6A0F
MSKKSEQLTVVAAEPIEQIDESTKTTSATTTNTNTSNTTTTKTLDEVPINDDDTEKKSSIEAEPQAEAGAGAEQETEAPPPARPPRPVDPITQVTNELKEAFPNIEEKLITAVLIASQGQVDPAFNALLYISDPSFKPEIPVPQTEALEPKTSITSTKPSILSEDEILARRLQKEFENEEARRRRRHERKKKLGNQNPNQQSQQYREDFDDSPDEFDQIKETFSQGLEDARSTLNGWVSNLAKRFDGNDKQGNQQSQQYQQQVGGQPKLFGALGGSQFNRRGHNKFDEDPEILSSDFHRRISLNDNEKDTPLPGLPTRPTDKPLPQHPPQSDSEVISSATPLTTGDTTKSGKKWQPLEADVPANSDAFLVTDSEDEDTTTAATTAAAAATDVKK